MSSVKAPPIYEPLSGDDGKSSIPWILFFNSIFKGDTGVAWTPTFTSLTETGTPTITGRVYRLSAALSFFSLKIIPATDTSAVAGTTYINNYPLTMTGDGICFAVSGLLGSGSGMCDSATNRIYTPAWTTVTVPLSVIGLVEAS